MSKPLKTARELCALVESHLSDMSSKEQERFWLMMTNHAQNKPCQEVLAVFLEGTNTLCEALNGVVKVAVEETNDLHRKLKKHRKPVRNAARDAEIMKLRGEGKSSAKIAQLLKGRWKVTSGAVRLITNRKKPKAD